MVDRYTKRGRFAQMLGGGPNLNNGSIGGGLAEMLKSGLQGYMLGADQRDQRLANEAMAGADPKARLTALEGMKGNEYAGRLASQLRADQEAIAARQELINSELVKTYDPVKGAEVYQRRGDIQPGMMASAPQQIDQFEIVENPYGQGGFGQRNVRTGQITGYQPPRQDSKPVPGRDVPYPPDVMAQRKALVEAAQSDLPQALNASMLNLANESREKVFLSRSIASDLGDINRKIDSGELDFGLFSNAFNNIRNGVGLSNSESRSFSSFLSTLEKMRNDSLRLNSGVQTEGDAQRAWNELFQSLNDKDLVKSRLEEIQKINQRAAILHEQSYQEIYTNSRQQPPPIIVPGGVLGGSKANDYSGWSTEDLDARINELQGNGQ